MGVSQEAMDAVEVRRDLMHHVSSTFDHVFVGKTAACVSDLTEAQLATLRGWHSTVVKEMAAQLNDNLRHGKAEVEAAMRAEDMGVRFCVPASSSNTRMHVHFCHRVEVGSKNSFRLMKLDESSVAHRLLKGTNSWRVLLAVCSAICKPLGSLFYVTQKQNCSAHCHLAPVRRILESLKEAAKGNDMRDVLNKPAFRSVQIALTRIDQKCEFSGVALTAGKGMRAYTDGEAVVSESLNDDKVHHFLMLLLRVWQKELSRFLKDQPASVRRCEKLFFSSAVEMAAGKRKDNGDWELENSEKAFSHGMSDVNEGHVRRRAEDSATGIGRMHVRCVHRRLGVLPENRERDDHVRSC